MNCPKCNSEVHTVVDTRDPDPLITTRRHWCGKAACGARWSSTSRIDKHQRITFHPRTQDVVPKKPPSVVFSKPQQNGSANHNRTDEETQSVGLGGGQGVGLSTDSSSRSCSSSSGSESLPPPLFASDQGEDRARGKLWNAATWKNKFGIAWCAKYGAGSYGNRMDGRACGDLSDLLAALSRADVLAAQDRAQGMIAEYLSIEHPSVSDEKHPFSFFVTRFGGLRVAAPKTKARTNGHSPVTAGKDYSAGLEMFKKGGST